MRSVLLIALLSCASSSLAQTTEITAENWMRHPDIKVVRALYQTVENAAEAGRYFRSESPSECDADVAMVQGVLYEDQARVVRKYVLTGGSEDSAGEARYYYDEAGRLRFTFITLGAVNGTHQETRVYFDAAGEQLYRDVRLIEGPGWPGGFPETLAEPRSHFYTLCE